MKQVFTKELEKNLRGKIILPTDPGYDEARKVYNGMIDKYPAAIVQCADEGDIVSCINFARQNDMLLAVRAGGHHAAGLGVADNALVIDLSGMKEIKVNQSEKTVQVQGGCLLKELDAATHEAGMVVPSGIFGTTGVAGLTLGGGLGNFSRVFGLSIDNLLEADVILANGEMVKASERENSDLFWALRGGGGNFGVVTSFTFRMHPLHTVYAGPMLWEMEEAEEMMAWHDQFLEQAPNELSGYFAFLTVPPFAPFPEHLHLKKMCGVVWCYTGDLNEAEKVFAPIRARKLPALDFTGPIKVPDLQTLFDGLYPPGLFWYWKADYMKDLPDEAIKLHLKFANSMPTRYCTMHMYVIDGAASTLEKTATAWNYRDAKYAMVMVGISDKKEDQDKITAWTREYWEALHPFSLGGAYVNMMMDEGEDRIKASYGDNYKRLTQVKGKYDPENLFRVNQNIKPQI